MRTALIPAVIAALLLGCGKKPEAPTEGDAQYAERMARQHAADQPTASPAATVLPSVPIKSQTVPYAQIDGQEVRGYLAYPASAEGGLPGVLVFHEWWGLNDNIRSMADQLAAQGYVALAPDLYRGTATDKPDQAKALLEQTLGNRAALEQNLRQAHAYLREQIKATRIGTIGWCFGGGASFQTALLLPDQVDAAVVYYGHVSGDPAQLQPLKAPLLALFGAADQGIPVADVQAFEAALESLGKNAQIHIYEGAGHAFANPSGQNYKADAAADAWQKSLAFLATHLKGG